MTPGTGPAPGAAPAAGPADPGVVEVLLVDDDPDILTMLGFVFDDGRFSVREAADGRLGLRAVGEQAPDVIVTDLMMPNLDGFGMLEAIRREGLAPDARVVVLSARNDPSDLERGRALGVDEHAAKPFDPDALADLVWTLGRRHPGG